jgi:hypothetical protein
LSKYTDDYWNVKKNVKFNASECSDMSYIEAPVMSECFRLEMEEEIGSMFRGEETLDEWRSIIDGVESKYWKKHNDYWNERKFVDILVYGSGNYKFIDGPAGSGKSTIIKAIYKMCNSIILTPNNNQKITFDGLRVETIDMYLTQMYGKGGSKYDFVLIDEYTHMKPENLKCFDSALLFGNVMQLKIGKYLDYNDYDHCLLEKVNRCDEELEKAALSAKSGKHVFESIGVVDALKNGWVILAATHKAIEQINDIALKMDLVKVIRFTRTDLKKDIFAGDMGVFENGLCYNNRNGNSYKFKVGRNHLEDMVVYGYARTYHATQGLEFDNIVLCLDGASGDMLYTGATRVHNMNEVKVCSLDKESNSTCGLKCKFAKVPHKHLSGRSSRKNYGVSFGSGSIIYDWQL